MLLVFLVNGYREEEIKRFLKALNLPFSKEALDNVVELIREKLQAFLTQPLPSEWFAIFINAFQPKCVPKTDKSKKHPLYRHRYRYGWV